MTSWDPNLSAIAMQVRATASRQRRKLIALAGAPGSGKSTLGEALAGKLTEDGTKAAVVPMDGFHLDNRIIAPRGDLARKGAPHTFDAAGLLRLLPALEQDDEVYYPLFDRRLDCAIAGAGALAPDTEVVIVEGNYLLLDQPDWQSMTSYWDMTIMLYVPFEELERRLVDRWEAHGLTTEDAVARARSNDLPNARAVIEHSMSADLTVR